MGRSTAERLVPLPGHVVIALVAPRERARTEGQALDHRMPLAQGVSPSVTALGLAAPHVSAGRAQAQAVIAPADPARVVQRGGGVSRDMRAGRDRGHSGPNTTGANFVPEDAQKRWIYPLL